jgi:hypothetical protein
MTQKVRTKRGGGEANIKLLGFGTRDTLELYRLTVSENITKSLFLFCFFPIHGKIYFDCIY